MSLADAVPAGLRTSLMSDTDVTSALGGYEGEPAIFTRVPVPTIDADAYPMIVIPPAAAVSDEDGLSASHPILVRDLMVYGQQPDHFRVVERLGYMLREKFHRSRFAFAVEDHRLIAVTVQGPAPAPTDDDTTVGRRVTLTIELQPEG